MCRRGRCLPSWSVGDAVQLFASGRIMMQLVVYGRLRDCSRSRKIRAPQRRAIGTEKSLCRQGATQGVAPTLLSCPNGFAVCAFPTLPQKDEISFNYLGPTTPPLPRSFRRCHCFLPQTAVRRQAAACRSPETMLEKNSATNQKVFFARL